VGDDRAVDSGDDRHLDIQKRLQQPDAVGSGTQPEVEDVRAHGGHEAATVELGREPFTRAGQEDNLVLVVLTDIAEGSAQGPAALAR
jgi:hypothetical protein